MSYLVLARKYRPQAFDEIVGQEHVTQTLTNAIATGRLHHAFLFTGARGVGKTTAARILAKCLSCVNAPTATPCNVCDACREITGGTSVDVQEIDAASNNGVDNIRDLREAIRYAPVRGKKKVYILDEVHMLSGGAWNALLKTLEEPPPHAVFVFATTDPHKLPATILSRVQRYDFKLVPQRRIVDHLTKILDDEKLTYDKAALSLVARESGGSVRDALSLLDQVIASAPAGLTEQATAEVLGVADRTLLDKLGQAILTKDAGAALALVDAAFARGQDLAQLAHALLGHLRDLVVARAVDDPSALIDASPTELEALVKAARSVPAGVPELLFERFAKVAEETSKSAVPRYVLEVGLIALTRVEPLEPIGTLLAKLEALESRVEKGGGPSNGGGGGARATSASVTPVAQSAPAMQASAATESPAPAVPASAPAPEPSKRVAPQSFTELIEAVTGTDPLLADLAQSRLLARDNVHISLGFDRDFTADRLRARLPQLRAALKKVTGEDLAVEIIVGPAASVPATENLIEVEERKVDEDRERRRKEALEHPARKALDDRFGGTWKDPIVDDVEKNG
ncbi:MAG TPA: DNA polymerase III subunit gamma/tau [Polyangia bacterium]|nr:DNA polymerase III subunit gamma/tau [Polyangia bacterium]